MITLDTLAEKYCVIIDKDNKTTSMLEDAIIKHTIILEGCSNMFKYYDSDRIASLLKSRVSTANKLRSNMTTNLDKDVIMICKSKIHVLIRDQRMVNKDFKIILKGLLGLKQLTTPIPPECLEYLDGDRYQNITALYDDLHKKISDTIISMDNLVLKAVEHAPVSESPDLLISKFFYN